MEFPKVPKELQEAIAATAKENEKTRNEKNRLQKLIDMLRNAPMHGAEKDEPEGTRYAMISSTFRDALVQELEAMEELVEFELQFEKVMFKDGQPITYRFNN